MRVYMFEFDNNGGAVYNGGRRCGELYKANAGFVVNDSSPYGFDVKFVGDNDGGDVFKCGV